MKRILTLLILLLTLTKAQTIYFPPVTGSEWETVSPVSLNWNIAKIDSLYGFLEGTNTKAFIVLKDGKIVLEKYFGTFSRDSVWYWASAGKSLTAFLAGIAKQEGKLKLDDTTSKYLGAGWTSLTPLQESKIKIRNQLTMTTGLDDGGDPYCTLPGCLSYKADPGTRWAYHTAPYTLLDQVIQNATGLTVNQFFLQKIKPVTGMGGLYLPSGYNNVFFSTPRNMARYGLLILNEGKWGETPVLTDTAYFREMTNTSNQLNRSYGYLWWLNGKDSYMVPQSQFVFPGMIAPDAPADMFSALGKNGQILNIVPSQNLVTVRMGDAPGSSIEVPWIYNNEIWKILKQVINWSPTSVEDTATETVQQALKVHPNPVKEKLSISIPGGKTADEILIYSMTGESIRPQISGNSIDTSRLASGVYQFVVRIEDKFFTGKFVKVGD